MILSRLKFYPQERFDLEDMNTLLSAARTDAKLYTKQLLSKQNLILKGFTVSGIGLKAATVEMDNATLLLGAGSQDFSYFISETTPTDIVIPDADLVDGVRNYVEIALAYTDGTPITKAFWDPSANGGLGAEFNQQINTVTDLSATCVVVQGGFTGNVNRIPLCIIDTDGSGTIKIILDRRPLFGRLGTPSDPTSEFTWTSNAEPPYAVNLTSVTGTFVAGETVTFSGGATAEVVTGGTTDISIKLPSGTNFATANTLTGGTSGATATVNTVLESFTGADKDLDDLKEILSALQTEIKRLKGTNFWHQIQQNSLSGLTTFINTVIVGLTSGAKYTWSGTQLSISDASGSPASTDNLAKLRMLGKAQTLNLRRQDGTASTSAITLTDGQVLFVKLPASGDRNYSGVGSGDANYQVVAANSFVLNDTNYWLAVREGNKLYIRGYGELMTGESAEISDPISQQILTFIGATSEADSAPNYPSATIVTQGGSLVQAVGQLDSSLTAEIAKTEQIRNEAVIDRAMHLHSDEPVTWTGTALQFTQPIQIRFPLQAGGESVNQLPISLSPITIANNECLVARISRTASPGNMALGTYPGLAANEYAIVAVSALNAVDLAHKDHVILFKRLDTAGGLALLYIPLHKQVLTAGQSVQLGASGAGGEASGTLAPTPGYKMLAAESFTSTQGSDDDTVDQTYTNAVYDPGKKLYQLSVDKSKVVSLNVGTAFRPNLAPSFVVAIGDIVYVTSGARVGQWRRIAGVVSQTNYVLDAAFSGGNTTAGDTLMICQAVWTKDLVNFGDAAEFNRPRDFYAAENVDQILVDYTDSLVSGDDTGDFIQTARVVMSASNEGLQSATGLPTTDLFTQSFYTRPAAPTVLTDFSLSANANNERLFLVFFPNPNNASVTTICNLLDYECNFYQETEAINGGVLDSAYVLSDGTGTPYNCTIDSSSGLTHVDLTFSVNPSADPGGVASQVEVRVNGQDVPKFVSSSVTPSTQLSYTLTTGTDGIYRRIQFNANLSVSLVDIKIVRHFGVYDASFTQTAKLTGLYDAIVGTAAQVTAGVATHSTLQAAHDAVAAGSNILVLNNVTLSGNTTLSKRVMVLGKGPGSVLTGNLTVASGAVGSIIKCLKVTGNIAFQAGADRCFMTECYQTSSSTFSNDASNVDNVINVITET
jgi:hypothetical protein